MKKKIVWLVVNCLIVLVLVLASCAPAVTDKEARGIVVREEVRKEEVKKEEVKEEVAKEEKVMVKDSLGRMVEKPQYGGWFNLCPEQPSLGWDQTRATPYMLYPNLTVTEPLIMGNWEMGPAGTNETSWLSNAPPEFPLWEGHLAESWEVPERGTVIYHLRKGVHFGLNPNSEASRLVGGREVTADDVTYTINWVYSVKGSYFISSAVKEIPVATTLDKYTVEIVCPNPITAPNIAEYFGHLARIVPPEVVEKYGNTLDWRNVVGTGPFMVVDEVPSSSTTLVRNPNYWKKDPLHPENQLPYLDGINWLDIRDESTIQAALRTGKIDYATRIDWEDAEGLMKTNPELQAQDYYDFSSDGIFLRADKPESPLYDIKVRQALQMAIDRETIVRDLYGGKAELFSHPISPQYKEAHIPLKDQPQIVQDIYTYNPEKAKQLLAEAGYPDGFKTSVIAEPPRVEYLSVIKDYWDDISVDMTIDVKEYGVWRSIGVSKAYDNMYARHIGNKLTNNYFKMMYWVQAHVHNYSQLDDPKLEDAYIKFQEMYYDWDGKIKLTKELIPYILENAWFIPFPVGARYTMWQPWVKRFYGEWSIGYLSYYTWTPYIWYDLDLKNELRGTR
ncbi:ABC transporter substrate-binding protein [Chloroflexota bacterium]